MKERLNYIDIAKGIGIFSVVLVHYTVHGSFLSQILLPYCVAIFFIISGMLFSEDKTIFKFVKSLVLKMIIPFIVYQIIDMLYTLMLYVVKNYNQLSIHEMLKIVLKVSFVTGSANSNGPLWFLPALIYTEIVVYIIIRFKIKWINYAFLLIMLCLAYFLPTGLPFRIQQIPSSCVLFMLGFLTKKKIKLITGIKNKWLLFVLCVMAYGALIWINGLSELAALNFGRFYLLFWVEAYIAFIMILTLSMMISHNRILEFYGKNSMTVMCCHYILARHLVPFLFLRVGEEKLLTSPLVEIMLAVSTMLVMYPICIFVNNHIKVLVGQHNFKWVDILCRKKTSVEKNYVS